MGPGLGPGFNLGARLFDAPVDQTKTRPAISIAIRVPAVRPYVTHQRRRDVGFACAWKRAGHDVQSTKDP